MNIESCQHPFKKISTLRSEENTKCIRIRSNSNTSIRHVRGDATKILTFWNLKWYNRFSVNKLRAVKPHVTKWSISFFLSRRNEISLRHSCLNHTVFFQSFLFNRSLRPQCSFCDSIAIMVIHVILKCLHYTQFRRQYGLQSSYLPFYRSHEQQWNIYSNSSTQQALPLQFRPCH